MKRFEIEVVGHVQGVGFRSFVEQESLNWDVTGTVKNMDNGNVLIYVQGEESQIQSFLSNIKKGNQFSKVEHVATKEKTIINDELRFRTIY
ncbi:acylphosphatase [Shouchella patagoniensis]|uniref:acylphosphatase n=1 Tax=Shouchella patagoniensis TaxID=228576 RepID=UPI0009955BA3|nr:acylphosphatase [Shouchella patagoniensis]